MLRHPNAEIDKVDSGQQETDDSLSTQNSQLSPGVGGFYMVVEKDENFRDFVRISAFHHHNY